MFAANKRKIILRNPKSVRPWQYVLEPLSGLLLIGSKLTKNSKQLVREELKKVLYKRMLNEGVDENIEIN